MKNRRRKKQARIRGWIREGKELWNLAAQEAPRVAHGCIGAACPTCTNWPPKEWEAESDGYWGQALRLFEKARRSLRLPPSPGTPKRVCDWLAQQKYQEKGGVKCET